MGKVLHVFDIDGTIITADGLINALDREYSGFNARVNYREHDFIKSLQKKGITITQEERNNIYIKYGKEILQDAPLVQGFKRYLDKLNSLGEDYIYLTARRPVEIKYTEGLFKDNGMEEDLSKVIYCGKNYGEPGEKEIDFSMNEYKKTILKEKGYNLDKVVLYEDRLDTCETFYESGAKVYLINQVYNEDIRVSEGIIRVNNFDDIFIG